MNKKGFTLVEILVSIGLLALLGSVIAISLNRVFKDNNIKNYNEFVEKVKSSAMLYVNNTVDIINDLNDSSFKIITIGDLVDNGYLNDNLVNPNTNEKVGKNEEIQVFYDSDHELIVEYPYNNSEIEAYLYTLNYSAMYGDTTDNLCYVGLNTRSLQLINLDGQKVKDLILNQTIRAYMENGEECTNLTSEKIGTYKIRYDYTKEDNKTLDDSDVNKRSAERTITVKPSKPVINKFKITKDKNAVYNPTITYNVSDSSKKTDMELKYCINTTGKISDCSNWSEAKNSQDTSLKINLNEIEKNISGKNNVDIYLFVKNGFEEYTYKRQNYKIKTEVIVKLNGGKYNNNTNDFTKYVDNGVKLGSVINLSLFTRVNHKFEGLKNTSGTSYNADTVITDDVTLTAQWYEYCSSKKLKSTSCSKTCGGGNIINHYVDTKYSSWECGEKATSITCNNQKCYTVKPSKPIINKFEVTKDKNAVYNPTITYNVSDSSKKTDMELKYCINTTGKISDCSNWSEAKNSQDTSLKINLNEIEKNISGKNNVDIYLFVKNVFEEYTYKRQNYKIKTEVIVKLNGGKYNNNTNDFTKYVDNVVKLGSVINLSLFTRVNHKFEGLKNTSGTSYNADTVITDDVTLTAQWYEYCVNKTLKSTSCSKTCGGGNIINRYVDTKYSSWECGEEATSKTCNTQNCYTRCDETYTTKECEQYSDWPIQYHYYKYDKRDNSLCESWWSGETCSLGGGGSSGVCISSVSKQLKFECDCYIGDGIPMLIWYDDTYCYCCRKG